MEDDFSGQISLNLSTDTTTSFHGTKKIFGNRSSRIKQRRAQKSATKTSSLVEKSNDGPTNKKRKYGEDGDPAHRTAPTDADGAAVKKKKSDAIISSLFRKNPEIPLIHRSEVDTVTENVFTGHRFKDLPLHPYLISNLEEKQGFKEMTEVQRQAIPVILQKKDALIKSQTGSGKTLAYAVPIVQSLQSRMVKVKREDGPYVLVIVPTRELALQSYDTFAKLLKTFIWIVPGCLMGGEKRKAEKARLRKGVNILVATPGRLMDHIKMTSGLSLARIQWLVIDEADRLLELGYERDVAQIINALRDQCPDPPQTVLLSATLSQGIERLSSITLNDPIHINVTDNIKAAVGSSSTEHPASFSSQPSYPQASENSREDTFTLPSQLRQYFIITPCKLRLVALASLILWKCKYSKPASKMIVFLSTQDSVEFHARLFSQVFLCQRDIKKTLTKLAFGMEDVGDSEDENADDDGDENGNVMATQKKDNRGLKIFQLHGDMTQKDRSQTYSEFFEATSGVLLCTDVAARGIDLPHVDWIVQYTSPGATVDYIHRVGRTARAGTKGQSLLFLMPSEAGYIEELNRHKISLSQLQLLTILEPLLVNVSDLPQPQTVNTARQKPRTQEEAATYLQDRFEECVLGNKEMHSLAGKGFQSYIRAYATYSKEVKDFMKVSDLHLGHVAKSFALREAPTKVHGVTLKFGVGQKKNKKSYEKPSKRPQSFKQAVLSESSAGWLLGKKKGMAKPGGKKKKKPGKR